jgi:D-3-phosphoglycerate dehydrogenase
VTSLNRGRPGMAAIDVFETEPILQGHTLLRMENCICTPHIGYVERESYEMYFSIAFQNILEVLQGNVDSVVNPTALAPALIRA